MESIVISSIICLSALLSIHLILQSIERITNLVYKEKPIPIPQDITPLIEDLNDMKSRLSGIELHQGFKRK